MKKNMYIQPQSELFRLPEGESLMRDLANSGDMGEAGKAPAGDNGLPMI